MYAAHGEKHPYKLKAPYAPKYLSSKFPKYIPSAPCGPCGANSCLGRNGLIGKLLSSNRAQKGGKLPVSLLNSDLRDTKYKNRANMAPNLYIPFQLPCVFFLYHEPTPLMSQYYILTQTKLKSGATLIERNQGRGLKIDNPYSKSGKKGNNCTQARIIFKSSGRIW